MREVTIKVTGKTDSDVEDAVREALKRLLQGNVFGMDRNESGSFQFEVTGEEELEEHA